MIARAGPGRKHFLLLMAIVVMVVAQPLLGHKSVEAGAFFDAVFAAICLHVLLVVLGERSQRRVGLTLIVPGFAANFAHYLLPGWAQVPLAVVFHSSVVVFLAFAVAVILRDIFRKRVISGDDVVGALCGYLLGGLVWARVYSLTYVLAPEAFSVRPEIAWRLSQWHAGRALFDYLSFTTLTSLGYSDISPAAPPVYSLSWLEVIFGQFYMAVVVAQLVGLKLAEAIKRDGPESQ